LLLSLLALIVWLIQRIANLFASLMQVLIELFTGAFGTDFHIVRGLFGIFSGLFGSLTGLFTRSRVFRRGARSERNGKSDGRGWFHTRARGNSLAN